jgi:hypothetical protein
LGAIDFFQNMKKSKRVFKPLMYFFSTSTRELNVFLSCCRYQKPIRRHRFKF